MKFDKLLQCQSTKRNITWANEGRNGKQIQANDIDRIKPRCKKDKGTKKDRTKNKAEVYTPTWICNKMISEIDEQWTGTDTEYISRKVLEITCGEGAFITTRYDTTTGEDIPIEKRIGLLDRKINKVNKISKSDSEWISNMKLAYKSTYGYEYQGDSLWIARMNCLMTFIESYVRRFKTNVPKLIIDDVINIITWNMWQMDGLTGNVPFAFKESEQISLFEDKELKPVLAKIKDWDKDKEIYFIDIK